jgi:predicted CoA-binding protein
MGLSMGIPEILRNSKVIAVVGLSDKPERPSYGVASYLLEHGYTIIPINPNISGWKGLKAYASLGNIPKSVQVDVVDIFRKSEDVPPVVDGAIKIKAKTVWMQLGIINEAAAAKARAAGLNVVMDRCMRIEHSRLSGR